MLQHLWESADRTMVNMFEMMQEAIGAAVHASIGGYLAAMVWNDEPVWIQRIKQGQILPWMIPRTRNDTRCHAVVVTNRMICSLRVQTHTTK